MIKKIAAIDPNTIAQETFVFPSEEGERSVRVTFRRNEVEFNFSASGSRLTDKFARNVTRTAAAVHHEGQTETEDGNVLETFDDIIRMLSDIRRSSSNFGSFLKEASRKLVNYSTVAPLKFARIIYPRHSADVDQSPRKRATKGRASIDISTMTPIDTPDWKPRDILKHHRKRTGRLHEPAGRNGTEKPISRTKSREEIFMESLFPYGISDTKKVHTSSRIEKADPSPRRQRKTSKNVVATDGRKLVFKSQRETLSIDVDLGITTVMANTADTSSAAALASQLFSSCTFNGFTPAAMKSMARAIRDRQSLSDIVHGKNGTSPTGNLDKLVFKWEKTEIGNWMKLSSERDGERFSLSISWSEEHGIKFLDMHPCDERTRKTIQEKLSNVDGVELASEDECSTLSDRIMAFICLATEKQNANRMMGIFRTSRGRDIRQIAAAENSMAFEEFADENNNPSPF